MSTLENVSDLALALPSESAASFAESSTRPKFDNIPREIRYMIYKFLLADIPVTYRGRQLLGELAKPTDSYSVEAQNPLAILHVSKQTNEEARPFVRVHLTLLSNFSDLAQIPEGMRKNVSTITTVSSSAVITYCLTLSGNGILPKLQSIESREAPRDCYCSMKLNVPESIITNLVEGGIHEFKVRETCPDFGNDGWTLSPEPYPPGDTRHIDIKMSCTFLKDGWSLSGGYPEGDVIASGMITWNDGEMAVTELALLDRPIRKPDPRIYLFAQRVGGLN